MAEFLPVGPDDAHTAMWLSGLAARDALPALDQLNDPRYVPYRVGHAVWAFLASHYGTRIVGATALDAARSRSIDPYSVPGNRFPADMLFGR